MSYTNAIVADIKSRMIIKPEDLDAYADGDEAAHIKNASEYSERVWQHIQRPEQAKGAYFPWDKTRDSIRHRRGELTLISGKEGSYKSMLTGMCHLGFMMQGEKCVIASMEMSAEETLERIEYQALGASKNISKAYHEEFYKWADRKLYIYEQGGVVSPRRLLGLARYGITELGIDNVLIDSLMTVDFQAKSGFELIEKQTSFVRELVATTKSTRGHVTLVAHLKKTDRAHGKPTTDDIDGSKKVTNLAQNIFFITKNLKKEEEENKPIPDPEIMNEPDLWMNNKKTRQGKGGSNFGFWLHDDCLQITERPNRIMPMVRSQLARTSFSVETGA